ncbi:MAG: HAMP domain-containing protein [Gammaproteobacteria bacterium]|nr:HAMP domain-containing protein [Gammaproteobacteria bacterium]
MAYLANNYTRFWGFAKGSDGIRNGVPLEENGSDIQDLTPQGFNQRMRDAISKNGSSSNGGDSGDDSSFTSSAGDLIRTSGFTIKTKLMASLSLLTLIILTLGVISFTSIVEINDLSIGIAERQSALAKVTEEIKTSVFRARDAEKDFLIKEEQEALDRSGRFITKLRGQLEKATELGDEIEKATGIQTGAQFVAMADAVDAYEQQFSEQVKNVKDARDGVDKDIAETEEAKVTLSDRADKLRLLVKGITDDFWINTKNVVRQSTVDAQTIADQAKAGALAAKEMADEKLSNDLKMAADKLKEDAKSASDQIAADKVVADKRIRDLAAAARTKFNRDADIAIVEATKLGTTRGTAKGNAALKGNDLDSNAAAVKNKALESQERLAQQNIEAAEMAAQASADALAFSATAAATASDKLAAAGVEAANKVFEEANLAADNALNKTKQSTLLVQDAVVLGTFLSDLDRELLTMQIQVARYLQLNKKSFADGAVSTIDVALSIADVVRRESGDEKMTLQMGEVRKQLLEYQKLFRNAVVDADQVVVDTATANAGIDAQKDSLKQTGEKLLVLATDLSDGAWSTIASESRNLQGTGNDAQNLLMILVVVGVLLGAFVLYAVPRPILAAINQLLMGAQRVAAGDLTQPITVSTRDELGQLAGTFDHMRSNLMSLVDRIQCASVQISTTVNEIQAASSQQSATSTEQAGALNEFSVTLREIAQSAEQLASNAGTVAGSSSSIATKVGDANSRSSQMMESMNAIGESTRQTSDRIKALNDQMDTITDAVSSISGVADQTTLLSLNAAIEANKAGEMGKGFSVVATEIRRLSDRSIDSAGGIGGMVRDIQRATESSVVSMDKSSEEIRVGIDLVQDSTATMQDVNLSMSEITSRTQEIAAGVTQQAVSSTEAQQTITELLSSSNTAAQAARQTSSAAYELNAMATQLSDAVAAFRT